MANFSRTSYTLKALAVMQLYMDVTTPVPTLTQAVGGQRAQYNN